MTKFYEVPCLLGRCIKLLKKKSEKGEKGQEGEDDDKNKECWSDDDNDDDNAATADVVDGDNDTDQG